MLTSTSPSPRGVSSPSPVTEAPRESKPSLFLRLLHGIRQVVLCGRGSIAKNNKSREPAPEVEKVALSNGLIRIRNGGNASPTAGSPPASLNGSLEQPGKIAISEKMAGPGVSLVAKFVQMVESHQPPVLGVEAKKLAEISQNMAELEEGAAAFKGPHFNATYELLQELNTVTGMSLDSVVPGVDPYKSVDHYKVLRDARKEILVHLASLTKTLNAKVHEDGKYCKKGCDK